jgi:fatty-acyl-CoA synthase
MNGNMMPYQLTLTSILKHTCQLFPETEIVSQLSNKSLCRQTYREFFDRTLRLAAALQEAGLRRGDRVATLMWNSHTHLEAYFGVPAAGGVLHTLNLRLHPSELVYIINHAEDRFLILDESLLTIYEQIRREAHFERVWVVSLSGEPQAPLEDYEEWLARTAGDPALPTLVEDDAASLCYTSGTTGKPKGVLYSHRALVLHALAMALPDQLSYSRHDVVLPAINMFHANAMGMPHCATLVGAKQVFPGPYLQAESLLDLMEKERVTIAGGVPTVWLSVLEALDQHSHRWKLMPQLRLQVGGSAAPESMIRRLDHHGIRLIHVWGMTETSPLCTISTLKSGMENLHEDRQIEIRARQGLPEPFVDLRAMAEDREVPWDGATLGELQVRSPWAAAQYYRFPEAQDRWTEDGWLRTGDVVNIDPEGYIKIADRTKDLIKSGGEWISSVDVENALVAHPDVREAAVIGVPHPKWQERPFAVVVPKDGLHTTPKKLHDFLAEKFAKWQLPDAIVFVPELPHTATGKLLKSELRKQYQNWAWT